MTIKHWSIHQLLIMGIIGILLFGCMTSRPTAIPTPAFTPSPDQMDKSPFTGVPCAAPCWQGLEVGKSSESEVTSVLSTLTFIRSRFDSNISEDHQCRTITLKIMVLGWKSMQIVLP